MTNCVDPDQVVSLEANWSGSTLFQCLSQFSMTRVELLLSSFYADSVSVSDHLWVYPEVALKNSL